MSDLFRPSLGLLGACTLVVACSSGSGSPSPDAASPGETGSPSPDGGSSSGGASADGGDAGGGAGDDAPTEGAAGDAGGVSCGSPDASGLPYTGIVELSRVMIPPAAPRWAGIGQFETSASAPPAGCSGMTMGACCYETTTLASLVAATAGTVTVTDGTTTLGTLTSPAYTASNAATPSFTWAPGTMLKISSSGATIGAFSATIAAPGLLAAVTPPFSAPIAVSLKSDLVVSWTPSTRACSEVTFGLSQGSTLPHIGCVVADSAGTLTVPAALLGMFTATSGTAYIERVEGKHVLAANAGIGIVALDVMQTTTTYAP